MANACKKILFRVQVYDFKSRVVLARVADCWEGQGIQRDLFLLLPFTPLLSSSFQEHFLTLLSPPLLLSSKMAT